MTALGAATARAARFSVAARSLLGRAVAAGASLLDLGRDRRQPSRVKRPCTLLPLLLAALAVPALARDAGANPWEVVGELLRQGGKPVPELRRQRSQVSKVEAAEFWDAFLTRVVKHAAGESDDAVRRQRFLLVLLSGRYDGVALLANEAPVPEPLRELFLLSWDRLAPELRQLTKELDSQATKSLRALLEAGDALRAAQALSDAIGVRVTPQALRELARLVLPASAGDPLAYDLALDPDLRLLFGFGPPLPAAQPSRLLRASLPAATANNASWLVASAFAAPVPAPLAIDPETAALARRLNDWLPTRSDLPEYLPAMRTLLQRTADATWQQREGVGRAIEPRFSELYRDLVLATAWQESCWRQFVRRKGKVQPIQSGIGAVGLMQVYPRVWRGFYDVAGLHGDVAYNGRAGAEILHHYLRDYALARSEAAAAGDADDLARATYAVYNGGPGHLNRYRQPRQRADLRDIDSSFLQKYLAVKEGKELEVGKCFSGADSAR
jgi:hypothetical protein